MTTEQKEKLAKEYVEKVIIEGMQLQNRGKVRLSVKELQSIVKQACYYSLDARDEEVERLENENAELSEQLKMNAENIQKLRAELKKAKNPNCKEQVVIPRWIVEKVFTALRLNYNTMVREGFEGCLRRQTATSYNYIKLFLKEERPTDDEIKRVALNYIDGEIDV